MISDFLQYCYEQGWSDSIYTLNANITLAVRILFLIFYRKKYNIKFFQTAIAIIIIFKLSDYIMLTVGWIESGFQSWTNGNFERVCVYIPLIALLVAKILKIPFGKMVGLGTIIVGVALALNGIFSLLAYQLTISVLAIVAAVVLYAGIAVGLGISFYAMYKYNRN
jgi:hypothetical protein